jgi:hypothetical protein
VFSFEIFASKKLSGVCKGNVWMIPQNCEEMVKVSPPIYQSQTTKHSHSGALWNIVELVGFNQAFQVTDGLS